MLSVIGRKNSQHAKVPDWIVKEALCWVLNQNVIPSKRIFIEGVVRKRPNAESESVIVEITTDNMSSEVPVAINLVFQRSSKSLAFTRAAEDLANLEFSNHAEIFRFINERLKLQKKYFECGVDMFHLNDYGLGDQNALKDDSLTTEKKIKEALNWLLDEKSLKPDNSNPYTFVASLIKNYWWTLETQSVLIAGEKQSGKSENLNKMIEFICFFNSSDVDSLDVESIRKRNISMKERRDTLEAKIPGLRQRVSLITKEDAPHGLLYNPNAQSNASIFSFNNESVQRSSMVQEDKAQNQKGNKSKLPSSNNTNFKKQATLKSQESKGSLNPNASKLRDSLAGTRQDGFANGQGRNSLVSKERSNSRHSNRSNNQTPLNMSKIEKFKVDTISNTKSSRVGLYECFQKELNLARKVLDPFVKRYETGGVTGSSAVTILQLETDDRLKFVGFNFKVKLLRTHELIEEVI